MIIRGLAIFITIFVRFGLAANSHPIDKHELTLSECAAKGGECDDRGRPVCGTDDRTYSTRCHLKRVQCSGHHVSLKYSGRCKGACKEARKYAKQQKSHHTSKFIPKCKPDGSYAPIQCIQDTGCWCSDKTGKPIEGTSVRVGKPKCRGLSINKINIRRSPVRSGGRPCDENDRMIFNTHLIKVFQSEYLRSVQYLQHRNIGVGSMTGLVGLPDENVVLDWKFAQLDTNGNDMLDKQEFRDLKKIVKRAVKPRRCGRAFGKLCDVNNDDRLSPSEWINCLRHPMVKNKNPDNSATNGYPYSKSINNNNPNHNDINGHHQMTIEYNSSRSNTLYHNNHEGETESDVDENDSNMEYDDYENDDRDSFGKPIDINLPNDSFTVLKPNSENVNKNEPEDDSNCLADQAAALENKQNGTQLYVPQCTTDGRYQRVQCYQSTPYCWCVNEDTGKNIPGTSVKDKQPLCDSPQPTPRIFKGCPEARKMTFLKHLKEFLKTQLLANTNRSNSTWASEEEKIATLSFVLLDKNKNTVWERKEWKPFREVVTSNKLLRKCGRKLPRYCDVNLDKKITLSEWLNCLQTPRMENKTHITTTASILSSTHKFSGKTNPLDRYLNDD